MSTPTNPGALPPPPRPAAGCLGVGCMSFTAFFVFLVVVLVGGVAFGLHYLRENYSSKKPLPIPAMEEAAETATPVPMATPAATPFVAAQVTSTAPTPLPSVEPVAPPPAAYSAPSWKAFEKAARHHQRAHIELTASEINALLQNNSSTAGKAFVRIEDNVGYVTVSIPLSNVMFMKDRYFNGHATVAAAADGSPAQAQISNIVVGTESVPDDFLDRRIFGLKTIRGLMTKWLDDENITSFRIENNRVIADAGG
ncbi:MAG: hypothetical protein M3Y86_04945 [Verrucomicrobiota bacterium]|nr:hypothetical protein [Verrucomicrobiota bacterium]